MDYGLWINRGSYVIVQIPTTPLDGDAVTA